MKLLIKQNNEYIGFIDISDDLYNERYIRLFKPDYNRYEYNIKIFNILEDFNYRRFIEIPEEDYCYVSEIIKKYY